MLYISNPPSESLLYANITHINLSNSCLVFKLIDGMRFLLIRAVLLAAGCCCAE